MNKKTFLFFFLLATISNFLSGQKKPNILFITVDDTPPNAYSIYSHGMMYPTPNIDRIGNEGAAFTDYYSQPSCTAGRSAFITGQLPVRTGLTTVGQPGNPVGLKPEDPTIAELLKPLGYMTGQIGKNHLGDRNEHLPTVHGFDEFYGNLYHLNVSEEPEQADYPKSKDFFDKYGPRGIIESFATNTDDPSVDARFGKIGKQKVKDLGPLTIEQMKTFDDVLVAKSKDFMTRAKQQNKPFLLWFSSSRNHYKIHLKKESENLATALSEDMDYFGSGLMEHDGHVGQLLDFLKANGLEENTIVIYTSDNGPEQSSWPYGGTTQFNGEKMTTWEGGLRVPFLVRWPKHIPAGTWLNGITDATDVMPTIYDAVTGEKDLVSQLRNGKSVAGMNYKVHLDGYNALDYWSGKTKTCPRNEIFYYYESRLTAVRYGQWKVHFATKDCYPCDLQEHGMIWLYNLKKDPYEKYGYGPNFPQNFRQAMEKSWVIQPIIGIVKDHLGSFKEWPVRQGAASLNINAAIDMMEKVRNGN